MSEVSTNTPAIDSAVAQRNVARTTDGASCAAQGLASALALGTLLLASVGMPSTGHAQSWSPGRTDPALWQVVSIDKTGEASWPYGREDVAGDGVDAFQADEATADLRSIYADAQADRLWLRAYVSATTEPSADLRAFFFLDNDARDNTGGKATGEPLDPKLGRDPTSGGYEIAIGVSGDGSVLGTWQWNAQSSRWQDVPNVKQQDVRAEVGVAVDPLAIGAASHGYVQTDLLHTISGLTATCGGTIFVRTLHETTPVRAFADDAPKDFACRASNDAYGDPEVLRSYACTSDEQCPADGRCRDGICLFTYTCAKASDCPNDETCSANRCVRVVDGSCDDAADCDGLLCQSSRCVACSESGAGACANGQLCSPNGTCVDATGAPPGSADDEPANVQGGPFSCSTRGTSSSGPAWLLCLSLLALIWQRRRTRKAGEHTDSMAGQP
jgi:MYXO-CTERM domain-containing protein